MGEVDAMSVLLVFNHQNQAVLDSLFSSALFVGFRSTSCFVPLAILRLPAWTMRSELEATRGCVWWTRGDSNPWPRECDSRALPAELRAHSSRTER